MTFLLVFVCGLLILFRPAVADDLCHHGTQKAFPSAEGVGACTVGGRGGAVIPVTNLNATGTGSLRACLDAAGPRTCIFRVGGTIDFGQELFLITNPYLTIAGQTAPGDGIMLKGQLRFDNTHDIIIRHLRVRPGPNVPNPATGRSLTFAHGHSLMVDHCSFGWSTDDTTSISWTTAATVQWCIFSEGLSSYDRGKGGINYGEPGTERSYLHNLFANFDDRIPNSSGGKTQVVNNVMYNVPGAANNQAVYHPVLVDFVANYWAKDGPATITRSNGTNIRNLACGWNNVPCDSASLAKQQASNIYVKGNIHTTFRPDETYPEAALVQQGGNGLPTQWTTPHSFPPIATLTDAFQAREAVLADAGVTVPTRDAIDLRAVNDVLHKTGTVNPRTPDDVGGYPTYASGTPYPDVDGDGMADTWESSHGLNPDNQADGAQVSSNGYTHLENFLNELAGDTIPGNPYGDVTDILPPVVSNPRPAGEQPAGSTILVLAVDTDEPATCRYDARPDIAYAQMTEVFTETGGRTHQAESSGFQDGQSYTYHVRCQDAVGNTNMSDAGVIAFSLASEPEPPPGGAVLGYVEIEKATIR